MAFLLFNAVLFELLVDLKLVVHIDVRYNAKATLEFSF